MHTGLPARQVFCIHDTGIQKTIIWGTAILGMLFFLDILSTEIILKSGGVEQNPVMEGIVQWPLLHLVVKSLLLVLVIFMARAAEGQIRGSGKIFFVFIIGMYILVIGNNLGTIAMNMFTG
ncbi:DUF5658 family protein [Methanoregula sp.]|uniref:DUF5658 family protein n=1 Tax=Methanoregula sp. TaxID=2052170 RepID=UPI0035638CD5